MKTRRTIIICLAIVTSMALWSGMLCAAENKPILKKGDSFPGMSFTVPPDLTDRDYLGIGDKKSFVVADIAADVLLVEIMNINCGSCQHQAPYDNKLFELIEGTPEATGRIKMMAISAGTTYADIQDFKDYFKTPYPVIADPEFELFEAIGRSPTPLAVFLIRNESGKLVLVADTHLGTQLRYKKTFEKLQSLLSETTSTVRQAGETIEDRWVTTKPVLSEEKLLDRIKAAFKKEGEGPADFKTIQIQSIGTVYTGIVKNGNKETRLFALPVSRPLPCDLCHDIHFIYLFNATGKILSFIPIQLAKFGNEPLNEGDIDRLKKRIEGHFLYQSFDYNLKVDAVSAATITSSVVYKNIQDGRLLYDALIKEGLIAKDSN